MIIKGKRELKNSFEPEKEFNYLINLKKDQSFKIDVGNRVLMYAIENKNDIDVINIFNKLKESNNETTFSLIIRYYVKKNIDEALNILNMMTNKDIQIKKRTLMPILEQYCYNNDLNGVYRFYKKYIKKKIKLDIEDYYCIFRLALKNNNSKILKSFIKSLKRNVTNIDTKLFEIFEKEKENLNLKLCNVDKTGMCNNVKLKSIDLSKSEKELLLNNIENIYAKEKENKLNEYRSFLNNNSDINVLLDGANILFNTDRKITINGYHRIDTIYQYLKKYNNRPLIILHQRHYDYLKDSGLSKEQIQEVKLLYKNWNQDVYLTPYKMNDDWFFIYGSILKDNCKVVTNDQLRDHIFKISKKDLYQDVLKKWIERRVINYEFKFNDYENLNTLKLKFPLKYSVRVQKIENNWYIPLNHGKWFTLDL